MHKEEKPVNPWQEAKEWLQAQRKLVGLFWFLLLWPVFVLAVMWLLVVGEEDEFE